MKTAEHPDIAIAPPRRRRRWGRIAVVAGLIAVLLVGGVGVGIYKYALSKWNNDPFKVPSVSWAPLNGPLNILVLGSDSREGLSPADLRKRQYQGTKGRRSDSILLVHLFKDGKRAVVLSFPRDLRVEVPGLGLTKINAAYNFGPDRVVQTIENYTGLSINHYIEVNFAAFKSIVGALGGVDICASRPYEDKKAGLHISKPGCFTFDGDMALAWARSRSVEPDGDFGRIRRQQQLIRVMLQKATSLGIVLNPIKAIGVINAVSEGVKHDARFTLDRARGLAVRLRNAKESNRDVDFRMVPSFPKTIGDTSFVIAKTSESQAMFEAIKADTWPLPPYGKTAFSIPDPKDVTIRLIDASGKAGLAKSVKAELSVIGFDVLITIKTAPVQAKTEIWYRPGDELKVELVQQFVKNATSKVSSRADPKAEVTLVLGADAVAPSASPSP